MAFAPQSFAALDFILQVEQAYAFLMRGVSVGHDSAAGRQQGVGGKLLYAGELDQKGRVLVVAGNIAGAASLAATADPELQKQAIRDGVVDFLVTSLDEALRILKNEIRKGATVAVCVGAAPEAVEREMSERGVMPDLQRPELSAAGGAGFWASEQTLESADSRTRKPTVLVQVAWCAAAAPAQWLPRLDAIALDCLGPENPSARRWLRLAPRYLGRLAQGLRLLSAEREFALKFIAQVRERVESREIGVPVEIRSRCAGQCEEFRFTPEVETTIL